MIIDDNHGFAFIHIPKCAGTGVRKVLGRFDTTGKMFTNRIENHPQFGRIDMEHIPLPVLREYFPVFFDKVRSYYSVAIVRDPYARFPSSLSQYLVSRADRPMRSMTQHQVADAVEEVIRQLSRVGFETMLPHELIHFQNQHLYVYDRNVQVVSHLYTIEDVPIMLTELEKEIGRPLSEDTAESQRIRRKAMVYRSAAAAYAASALKSVFPASIRRRLPARIERFLSESFLVHRDARFRSVFGSKYVKGFILDYYKQDFDLYEMVSSQRHR
jgi:hypothetical protein